MRRFMIVVLLAAALAFGANEVGKRFLKPTAAGEPTITDTKTPKRGAPAKRSSSKRSTAKKVKSAQAKGPAGRPAKADAQVAKADGNAAKAGAQVAKLDGHAAKADVPIAKPVGNAAKADVPVAKVDGNTAKADVAIAKPVGNVAKVDVPVAKVVGNAAKVDGPVAKADGNAAKVDVPVAKADGNAAKAEAEAEPMPEKKTSEVAPSATSSGTTSVTSSGTTSTAVPAADASSKTITPPDRFSATAIGLKLLKDSKLRARIEAKLQAAGYRGTVYEAAYGFQNIAEFNGAIDMLQQHGYSFELLKVMMTGKYVDPETHLVYRAHQGADGAIKLLSQELATNPVLR